MHGAVAAVPIARSRTILHDNSTMLKLAQTTAPSRPLGERDLAVR